MRKKNKEDFMCEESKIHSVINCDNNYIEILYYSKFN